MRHVYMQRWARSTVEHYEFDNVGFAEIEGYEYYGALANNIAKHGIDRFNGFLADLQVWGTPEQVTEKLLSYVERTDAGGLVCPLVFGGMPADEAQASLRAVRPRGATRAPAPRRRWRPRRDLRGGVAGARQGPERLRLIRRHSPGVWVSGAGLPASMPGPGCGRRSPPGPGPHGFGRR